MSIPSPELEFFYVPRGIVQYWWTGIKRSAYAWALVQGSCTSPVTRETRVVWLKKNPKVILENNLHNGEFHEIFFLFTLWHLALPNNHVLNNLYVRQIQMSHAIFKHKIMLIDIYIFIFIFNLMLSCLVVCVRSYSIMSIDMCVFFSQVILHVKLCVSIDMHIFLMQVLSVKPPKRAKKLSKIHTNIKCISPSRPIIQYTNPLLLINEVSHTLTSNSCVSFRPYSNKTMNSYNFYIQTSNKSHFSMLGSPTNCYRESFEPFTIQ